MSTRTLVPGGLDPPLTTFLDKLARPVSAVANIAGDAAISAAAVPSDAIAAVVTTPAHDSTPFGYSEAQANAIVAAVNLLVTRVAELTTAVNTLRTDSATNAALLDTTTAKVNEALAAFRASGRMST